MLEAEALQGVVELVLDSPSLNVLDWSKALPICVSKFMECTPVPQFGQITLWEMWNPISNVTFVTKRDFPKGYFIFNSFILKPLRDSERIDYVNSMDIRK